MQKNVQNEVKLQRGLEFIHACMHDCGRAKVFVFKMWEVYLQVVVR